MVTIKNGTRKIAAFGEGRSAIEVLAGVQDHEGELTVAFMLPAGARIPKVGAMGSIGGEMIKVLKANQGPIDGMAELLVEYCPTSDSPS